MHFLLLTKHLRGQNTSFFLIDNKLCEANSIAQRTSVSSELQLSYLIKNVKNKSATPTRHMSVYIAGVEWTQSKNKIYSFQPTLWLRLQLMKATVLAESSIYLSFHQVLSAPVISTDMSQVDCPLFLFNIFYHFTFSGFLFMSILKLFYLL